MTVKPIRFFLIQNALPIILLLIDLIFRFNHLKNLGSREWGYYAVSILFSFLIYRAFLVMLRSVKARPRILTLMLVVLAGGYSTVVIGSYAHFYLMGIMPNYFTFEFIHQEFRNSFIILKDSLNLLSILSWMILTVFFVFLLNRAVWQYQERARSFGLRVLHFGLLPVLLMAFNNNVRFVDQCFVADVNSLSFIVRNVYNGMAKRELGSTGLMGRSRFRLTNHYTQPPFNVLLIVGESLRAQNLSIYGYDRPTTPFLSSLVRTSESEFFLFKNHFSNSTATLLSYPSILSGVSPVQDSRLFHSSPLIFEYAKTMNYETFLLTSQDYHFYNFRSFFDCPSIDEFLDQETSGAPAVNDLGADDSVPVLEACSRLKKFAENGKPFLGVIHLNTNHYPYHCPEAFRKWTDGRVDAYDNTVLYQDALLKRLFSALEENRIRDRTIVMFVSDHGEGFEEHGFIGHRGYHYVELIRVPFFLFVPKKLQKTLKVDELKINGSLNTQNLDVIPTLMDLMGLYDKPEIRTCLNRLQGSSLLRAVDSHRTLFIVNNNSIARYREGMSFVKDSMHYQFLLNRKPDGHELFNLLRDPQERRNLWDGQSDASKQSYLDRIKPFPELYGLYE